MSSKWLKKDPILRSLISSLSVHSPNQPVDQHLPVAMITSLNKVPGLLPVAPQGAAELEGPEEIVRLLEVRPHSVDLVNEVLHADDAILPKRL